MFWIAVGDVHERTGAMARIPDIEKAGGIIVTGDITNSGGERRAESVLADIRACNTNVMAQPGNMDLQGVEKYLRQTGMNLHLSVRELAPNLAIMGVGYSTPTPFNTPGEVSETQLAKWLDEVHSQTAEYDHLIMAIHEPPAGSKLDQVGPGNHVGSKAVRAFIERTQPALVITGHIHESRDTDIIGKTTVINPGMLANGGYVRIEFDGENVTGTLEML